MRLHSLTLSNFQGIKHFKHVFDGKNAIIYGDNATGKTTLFNSLTWLLFGNSSTGAKGYTPKTVDENGEVHGLEHTVEAVMILDDGKMLPLKKTYKEIWRKKRGSLEEEFSGHTVDYYINEVPVQEKEFLSKLPDADKMKLLTVPWMFAEGLSWQERRKVLIEMGGNITDEEVMACKELKLLPDILAKFAAGSGSSAITVEEYKKIAVSRRQLLNKALETLPSRIDEATKAIPEKAPKNKKDTTSFTMLMNSAIKNIQAKIEDLQKQKAELSRIPNDDFIRDKIEALQAKKRELVTGAMVQYQKDLEKWLAADAKRRAEMTSLDNRIYDLKRETVSLQESIKAMEAKRELLLEEYRTEAAKILTKGKAVCPCCNRELPEEESNKLFDEFNLAKSKRLEEINKRGRNEASAVMIKEAQEKLNNSEASLDKLNKERFRYDAEMTPTQPKRPDTENSEAYLSIEKEIKALLEGSNTNDANKVAIVEIHKQIEELRREESTNRALISDVTTAEKQMERIEELEAERKRTAEEYEQFDRGLRLCEIFTKKKMDMLSERVNTMFKTVSFRLFVEQVNGGVKEDCEVLIPGPSGQMVAFSFANNAARINAGLEIIQVLSGHYGFSMPVFVDNAEAVTKLADTSYQVIQLVVSEADKALRIV